MYKALSANDFKKFLNLQNDYKIDGFISYGAWDDEKHFANIQKNLDKLGIKYLAKKMNGFLSHILEIKIKEKRYWFTVIYGSALLSEYTHLACLFGSKKNIHIGSCGGLYPKMNSLDLIIPNYTYGKESSACIYNRNHKNFKHFSDKNLSKIIKQKIPKKYQVWNGPITTCQAMIGETFKDVKTWSKEGYYGVEMESATIFAVSKHFKIPSTSLLYVSDNLIKGQTVGDESHKNEKNLREEVKNDVYLIALKTILNLNL